MNNPLANAGHAGLIPGFGRSPGEGNGNACQYSCLDNPMDRGDWQAVVHGFANELDMTEQLNSSNNFFIEFPDIFLNKSLPVLILSKLLN